MTGKQSFLLSSRSGNPGAVKLRGPTVKGLRVSDGDGHTAIGGRADGNRGQSTPRAAAVLAGDGEPGIGEAQIVAGLDFQQNVVGCRFEDGEFNRGRFAIRSIGGEDSQGRGQAGQRDVNRQSVAGVGNGVRSGKCFWRDEDGDEFVAGGIERGVAVRIVIEVRRPAPAPFIRTNGLPPAAISCRARIRLRR